MDKSGKSSSLSAPFFIRIPSTRLPEHYPYWVNMTLSSSEGERQELPQVSRLPGKGSVHWYLNICMG